VPREDALKKAQKGTAFREHDTGSCRIETLYISSLGKGWREEKRKILKKEE
jgi:hypothetical protein